MLGLSKTSILTLILGIIILSIITIYILEHGYQGGLNEIDLEKIRDLENARECILCAMEHKGEILNKLDKAYTILRDTRSRLNEIRYNISYMVNESTNVNSSYIDSLMNTIDKARENISIAYQYIKNMIPCNTSSYELIDPGVDRNLSSALDNLRNISESLDEINTTMSMKNLSSMDNYIHDLEHVLDKLEDTIDKIERIIDTLESIRSDLDGFIQHLLDLIDEMITQIKRKS